MRLSLESLAFKRVAAMAAGLAALGAASGVCASGVQGGVVDEPKAMGLIVKLKDKVPQPLIKLKVSQRPADGAQSQRMRLSAAAKRQRVGFTANKPTAFGAHLIHDGQLIPLAEAEAEAARLRLDPDVEWVAVNRFEKPESVPPGPPRDVTSQLTLGSAFTGAYDSHYWLQPVASGGAGVAGFASAWALVEGLPQVKPVVVAVLDTGKLDHPDVDGRILPGYDFVSQYSNDGDGLDPDPTDPGDYMRMTVGECEAKSSSWHGLAIISMLTAPYDSGVAPGTVFGPGILSPLPGAQVLPVRIGGGCGALRSDIIEGMLWSAGVDYQGSPPRNQNPARVINLSFGGPGTCQTSSAGDVLYRQTINTLTAKGVVVVASAGNKDAVGPSVPASCPGVLAVTGLRANGAKTDYANRISGNFAAVGYRGLAVASGDSTIAGNNMNLLFNSGAEGPQTIALDVDLSCGGSPCVSEGTSFAAPQVAGVAALMMAVAPNLSGNEVRDAIMATAASRGHQAGVGPSCSVAQGACTCTTATCGVGRLDAAAAVQWAINNAVGPDYTSADASADYFVPDRLKSRGGGGGGGSSDASLLVLLAALASWMLGAALWQRVRANDEARRLVRHAITNGKR